MVPLSAPAGSTLQNIEHAGAVKVPRIKHGGVVWFKLIFSVAP